MVRNGVAKADGCIERAHCDDILFAVVAWLGVGVE